MEPYIPELLNLASKKFKISKLISSTSATYKYSEKAYDLIELLFNNIGKIEALSTNPFKLDSISRNIILENLSIVRSLLVGSP